MNTDTQHLSEGFQRLYCDAGVYDPFSTFHPISFARVLPFQSQDPVVDDERLIGAEEAHLANPSEMTRRGVLDAYVEFDLLSEADSDSVKSVMDFYGANFFELMGLVYANAGMFICALRWYREFIRELETRRSDSNPNMDDESVHASVGYCLYSLGLFAEAITWTKSCMGPDGLVDAVCLALMRNEAQRAGGRILCIERGGPRTRYTVSAMDPAQADQNTGRITAAMTAFAPFQGFHISWVNQDTPAPEIPPEGYPFKVDIDGGDLPRHKMNLLFATCGQADALVKNGHDGEARRLLLEAALLEPAADFIQERLSAQLRRRLDMKGSGH